MFKKSLLRLLTETSYDDSIAAKDESHDANECAYVVYLKKFKFTTHNLSYRKLS